MTVHIDEGFDFLGFRIQRQAKWATKKRYVYTWPSKKALASIKAKVKAITQMACRPARLTGCSAIASGGAVTILGGLASIGPS